jgi:two-component system, response regulator PdtaR
MLESNLKVLIVEDNPVIVQDIREELEDRGFAGIETADCLRDAIRSLDRGMPDVAIVDLALRDGDTGGQLAAALARSGVKVCVLSGKGKIEQPLMQVSHTYVCKPAPAAVIASLVENCRT